MNRIDRRDMQHMLNLINGLVTPPPNPDTGLTPEFVAYEVVSQGSNRYGLERAGRNVSGMGYLSRRDLFEAMSAFYEGLLVMRPCFEAVHTINALHTGICLANGCAYALRRDAFPQQAAFQASDALRGMNEKQRY